MMNILYENDSFLIAVKPAGVLSEDTGKDDCMPGLLRAGGQRSVFCVHRLDRSVGGVMVYAKSAASAAKLSKIVSDRQMEKEYLAVVHGVPSPEAGEMRDLLFKDSSKKKSFVVKRMRKGVKEAVLDYQRLGTERFDEKEYSLVHIRLHTGRSHQIRVQFSSRKMPLVGDRRYGSPDGSSQIALWSYRLRFLLDGKEYEFSALPENSPWVGFSGELSSL